MFSSGRLKSVSRSRWAAVGAAVAITVGAGGLLSASAASSPGASSFVPITPCRLMDTRPGAINVGPRATPIAGAETYAPLVWGTNGKCTIPASATAVSMNVTFVNPTVAGFVTVYPPDKPNPGTSSLNFVAGQAPAPNAVTSPLSADGKIGFFNSGGTVDLVADIVGYYEPPASGLSGTIPSGVTVTGVAGQDSSVIGPGGDYGIPVMLPARAPVTLTDNMVNFAGTAVETSDDDPTCTGTADNPTAPPGKVCLYLYGSTNAIGINGIASAHLGDKGFWIYWAGTGTAGTDMYVWLTWAYTAP
jgi:hypothetical protein